MSRVLPAPPDGVRLSPVPNKTVDDAVNWLRSELEMPVTARYIRRCVADGTLPYQVIARRLMFSTADLYAWVVGGSPKHNATTSQERTPR